MDYVRILRMRGIELVNLDVNRNSPNLYDRDIMQYFSISIINGVKGIL